jgi:hypothetical protein
MKPKVKCWEFFKCKETECPVYESKELRCWLVSGTHCRDEIQGTFLEKVEICLGCEPFRANVDPASLEQTARQRTGRHQHGDGSGLIRGLRSIKTDLFWRP